MFFNYLVDLRTGTPSKKIPSKFFEKPLDKPLKV